MFTLIQLAATTCRKSKRQRRIPIPGSFATRAKARTYCRNHYWALGCPVFLIVHPDKTEEVFHWKGLA